MSYHEQRVEMIAALIVAAKIAREIEVNYASFTVLSSCAFKMHAPAKPKLEIVK